MFGSRGKSSSRAQIALEFLVVYAFISIVFAVVFTLIAAQRAATLAQQEYGLLQLQAQNIASYIDQAAQAGNGYSVTVPLVGAINSNPFNISISTSGVVVLQTKIIRQVISAYAFSAAKGMVVNGTLTSSGNGVNVYLIPSYTGSLGLANSKGTIYVDEPAPSTVALAQTISASMKGNVKVARVGPGASLSMPINSLLEPPKLTMSVWFFETGYPVGYPAVEVLPATGLQGYSMLFPMTTDPNGGIVIGNGAETYVPASTPAPKLGVWNNEVATFDGTNVKVYLNGVLDSSGAGSGITYTGVTQFTVATVGSTPGNPSVYFSNIQLYNAALSSNQVNAIYQGGIALPPVMSANTIGWWPLNGNSNDYSGNGNAAYGLASYNGVIQESVHVVGGNGNALVSSLVGFTTSKGIVSPATGGGAAYYTDANGNATAFITQNGFVTGAANLTVTAFNGNSTLAGNLIGWWPLNEGFGNITYDFSTHGNSGNFANAIWSTVSQNQTNLAAGSFPGVRGALGGSNAVGFVTVNQSSSLLNLARNGSFTAVMWVDSYGGSASHNLGLIGDWPAHGRGFSLSTSTSSSANALLKMVVNGTGISSATTGNLPANNWEMIVGEYNGTTGQAAMFENSTQIMSNVIAKGLDLGQPTNAIYIGDDPWQLAGADTFNGLITNVQLYSRYLTTSQIASLYKNGINSAPIGDAGLTGWWPLNGANNGIVNDYSSNNNTGEVKYNVTFKNAFYVNGTQSGIASPKFNIPANSFIITNTNSLLAGANAISVSVWFNGQSYYAYNSVAQPGGHGWVDEEGVFGLKFSPPNSFGLCMQPIVWCATSATYNFVPNSWYDVVATWSSGNPVRYYVNGVLINSTSVYSGTITLTPGSLFAIGTSNGAASLAHLFNGTIANVQLYNAALTAPQVQQLYQQGILLQKRMNLTLG